MAPDSPTDLPAELQADPRTLRRSSLLVVAIALGLGAAIAAGLFALRNQEKTAKVEAGKTDLQTAAMDSLILRKVSKDTLVTWVANQLKASGAKFGVVNFWATWCEPCRTEMPELVKFQASGKAPLFLVSADAESEVDTARSFLIDSGVKFESAIVDGDQQAFIDGWLEHAKGTPAADWSMTLPATFVVDQSGKTVKMLVGETSADELRRLIDSL